MRSMGLRVVTLCATGLLGMGCAASPGPPPSPAALPPPWRSVEDLVRLGFARSDLVLVNEFHSGIKRSVRTRRVGRRVVRAAHGLGVRHFAMEALTPEFAALANRHRQVPTGWYGFGYLAQPDMLALIQEALDLGFTLVPYEADLRQRRGLDLNTQMTNWREEQQAENLSAALARLPPGTKLLVWCGNGHLYRRPVGPWLPMAFLLEQRAALVPFSIDQTLTVDTNDVGFPQHPALVAEATRLGGVAGMLREDLPPDVLAPAVDAVVAASENHLE